MVPNVHIGDLPQFLKICVRSPSSSAVALCSGCSSDIARYRGLTLCIDLAECNRIDPALRPA